VLGPGDLDTVFWVADTLVYAGDAENALTMLGSAWRDAGGHAYVSQAILAALARWDLEDLPQLVAQVTASPDTPWDVLLDAAELYALYGIEAEAAALVERAVWAAPDSFEARQRAFGAAEAAGSWTLAYDIATDAVVHSPNSGLPYLWRGIAKTGLGRCDDAIIDFETYLQSDIAIIDGLPQVVHALAAAGCADQASPYATRLARLPAALAPVVDLQSSPIVGLALAGSSYLEADAEAGLDLLDAVAPEVLYYPERGGLVIVTAQLLEEAGDWAAADAAYARARAVDVENSVLLNNHAYVLAVAGEDLERAEWMARHSIARDYEADANTFDTLGWVYYQMGDYERARRWLEAAARIAGHRTDPMGVRLVNVVHEHLDAVPEPVVEDEEPENRRRRNRRRNRGE